MDIRLSFLWHQSLSFKHDSHSLQKHLSDNPPQTLVQLVCSSCSYINRLVLQATFFPFPQGSVCWKGRGAVWALILLHRLFISFLKAGDYFSINNTGRITSECGWNQITGDKLWGGWYNELWKRELKSVEGWKVDVLLFLAAWPFNVKQGKQAWKHVNFKYESCC
jgi:hypothetical protein